MSAKGYTTICPMYESRLLDSPRQIPFDEGEMDEQG